MKRAGILLIVLAVLAAGFMAAANIVVADTGDEAHFESALLSGSREGVEKALKSRLTGQENPTVSLHCDKSVAFDEEVAMMRMAKANNFTLIAATSPE